MADLTVLIVQELGFRAVMACEFRRQCRGLDLVPQAAMDLATDTLKQFLKDEEIQFGDPNYGWEHRDALTIAREYETQHWDAA